MPAFARWVVPSLKSAWEESKHPRETAAHGGKRPGEFAPGGKRGDPVRGGLSPAERRHYDLLTSGSPEERAAKARHMEARIQEGRRAMGGAKPAPAAPAGGYGSTGDAHPLAGMDPRAQRQRLAEAREDSYGHFKPLGIAEAGPPDGLDMGKFVRHAANVMARHAEETSRGMDMSEAYEAIGKPFGLTKHDFLRAITAAHRDGHVRLSGWGQTTDEIPHPDLVTQISDKLFYFVNPGDGRKGLPSFLRLKALRQPNGASNFTGVSFGHYFLNGRMVSREEYLAARPNASGKPGRNERAQAKAGLPPPLPGAPTARPAPPADPRHNPALDELFNQPAHPPAAAGQSSGDLRANALLDEAFGVSKQAATPKADTSHIGQRLLQRRHERARARREAAQGQAPQAAGRPAVGGSVGEQNRAGREWLNRDRSGQPGDKPGAAPPAAGPGGTDAAFVPPQLPHHRTHANAWGAANKLVGVARDGGKPHEVRAAHAAAVVALHEHERAGHAHIGRTARAKYGDTAKGRWLAARAKLEFGRKMTAARTRMNKLAGPHGVRTGKLEKGYEPFPYIELDPEAVFQLADSFLETVR
jgi:hypothetical protein